MPFLILKAIFPKAGKSIQTTRLKRRRRRRKRRRIPNAGHLFHLILFLKYTKIF
jgi:hypothetical protein